MTGHPLRWREGRAVAISPDDREVWLFGGEGPVRLAGLGSGALARAVDGQRSALEVVAAAVAHGMESQTAERILGKWMGSGHLTSAPVTPFPMATVTVQGGTAEFAQALIASGLAVVESTADAHVVVVDDLLELSTLHLDSSAPVIAVQLRGETPLVTSPLGPDLGCAACIASRISVRRSMDLVAARRSDLDIPPPSPVQHPSAISLASGIVATQLQVPPEPPATSVYSIAFSPPRVERHLVVPVPGCLLCDATGTSLVNAHLRGEGADDSDSMVDGAGLVGFRTRDPEETWLAHEHHISPIVGIVPVVEPIGPRGLRTFAAGANVAGVDDPAIAASLFRNRGGGKGLTLSAARASALAEALERDALRARGDEAHRLARMGDVEGAIHPHDVQLFSSTQMQTAALARLTGAKPDGLHHVVPVPFDVDAEHGWSQVRSLTTDEIHWLPTSMLYLGWAPRGSTAPPGCSNGAAAGNTLAEAQLQGLLELVERDAVALWWYPRSQRKRYDLDSWDDPRVQAAMAPHVELGAQISVVDITSDLGIPAAAAMITDRRSGLVLTGAGAHTDPAIAVARALTEAAQMVAALTETDVEDPRFRAYVENSWDRQLTEADRTWVFGQGVADIPPTPNYSSVADARDDVVERIHARGYDVLWADLTRRDVDLKVVRTFAPGLRHFWRRLAPGRLYDVPLEQGWIDASFDESSVNPLEMPI